MVVTSSSERLRRAFSLRAGLATLFVPRADRLRPLDGLRALSILWVVIFHSAWFSVHLSPAVYAEVLFSSWMTPIWRGDFGVDVFFTLSGFLIGGMLLDERERKILHLRFFKGLTQSQIAQQVGISQMHVSRLIRRALEKIRDEIATEEDVPESPPSKRAAGG